MQFTIAAVLALAGSALAQTPGFNPLTNPTMNEVIPAGKPYTIKWTPQGGNGAPVSLYVYAGESASTLQEISTIAAGVEASLARFDWNVDAAIGGKYKAYGIKIALTSDKETYQWSNPFTVSAAEGSSSSSSAASTSASSTSSAVTVKTDSSSVVSTTKASASSTIVPTTSSSIAVTTPIGNLSTSATGTRGATTQVTLVTSTSRASSATGSSTAPATVPTGGAVAKGASSIAIIGGLAMAVLAL